MLYFSDCLVYAYNIRMIWLWTRGYDYSLHYPIVSL